MMNRLSILLLIQFILSDFKKHYWTLSFCDLFPYGRGGLEEKSGIQIGMKAYLFNLLRLSSRRFASHESLPLIAFHVIMQSMLFTSEPN